MGLWALLCWALGWAPAEAAERQRGWALGDGPDQVLGASLHLSGWPGALSPRAEPAEPGHGSPGVNVGNLGAWCLPESGPSQRHWPGWEGGVRIWV